MKLHTNVIASTNTIHDILVAERHTRRIAPSIMFKTLSTRNSRTHKYSYEIQLESWEKLPGDGRRPGNSGSYGAGDDFAATYDEWGWLISALYKLDADAVWGSVNHPNYSDMLDFNDKTGYSYDPMRWMYCWALNAQHATTDAERAECDPYGFVLSRTNTIGRRGFGRSDGENLQRSTYDAAVERYRAGVKGMARNAYVKYEPRTPYEIIEFSKLTVAQANDFLLIATKLGVTV